MTCKDYVAIARALREARTEFDRPNWNAAIDAVARELSWELHLDNPRFDGGRFLAATERGAK